jgi:hypothetical protein
VCDSCGEETHAESMYCHCSVDLRSLICNNKCDAASVCARGQPLCMATGDVHRGVVGAPYAPFSARLVGPWHVLYKCCAMPHEVSAIVDVQSVLRSAHMQLARLCMRCAAGMRFRDGIKHASGCCSCMDAWQHSPLCMSSLAD